MLKQLLIFVAAFINIGIILHILKFGPRIAFDFIISPIDRKRHLSLTFNGRPVFKRNFKTKL